MSEGGGVGDSCMAIATSRHPPEADRFVLARRGKEGADRSPMTPLRAVQRRGTPSMALDCVTMPGGGVSHKKRRPPPAVASTSVRFVMPVSVAWAGTARVAPASVPERFGTSGVVFALALRPRRSIRAWAARRSWQAGTEAGSTWHGCPRRCSGQAGRFANGRARAVRRRLRRRCRPVAPARWLSVWWTHPPQNVSGLRPRAPAGGRPRRRRCRCGPV